MLLYCFTSVRTGEVHKSTARRYEARENGEDSEDVDLESCVMAACYKHFELTIETVDGIIMLVLTYERKFVKGYWRKTKWEIPKYVFYEVYAEEVPIFLNLLTFFLPIATADKAFRDYGSVYEILNAVEMYKKAGPSEDKILEVIYIRQEIRDLPVFRQYLEYNIDKFKGYARGADLFGKALVNLGYRSGYTLNITIRIYSESARIKFARQTNRNTYGKLYAHPLSLYRNSSLLQLLPTKAEYKFLTREDVYTLNQSIANLSLLLSDATPEERHEI
ncbi:hypothetical protein N7491_006319 [Penicillium cf. griseofulvum]|uniref:Uncharacterized protein n=1 Tax=Penicillium cf. griseofulvum TaxID=2972120 RepID=A0A9W9IXG6_9EURO|nr:hypothetical protein N7472_010649 [Penicillium cf. griseofulvum]KAJ5429303.1 hypothetical protein N7491_006319 [Penicillium cf. griseofulvum]